MILLIDKGNASVVVYTDNGKKDISFEEIEDLHDIVGNESFLYVTDAVETDSDEVVNLVRQLVPAPTAIGMGAEDIDGNEVYFLRSCVNGPMLISEAGIKFNGPTDMKEIDEDLLTMIKRSVTLQEMIKKKQIEIVDRRRMSALMRQNRRDEAKKEQQKEAAQQKISNNDNLDGNALDVTIIDGSAADFAANIGRDGDNMTMDITDEVKSGPQ
tara:strand:- start:2199 stop:2837 length:639 start_codon:yes stop_codon:yes gene_type:complete